MASRREYGRRLAYFRNECLYVLDCLGRKLCDLLSEIQNLLSPDHHQEQGRWQCDTTRKASDGYTVTLLSTRTSRGVRFRPCERHQQQHMQARSNM